jgi:hypothetical protein
MKRAKVLGNTLYQLITGEVVLLEVVSKKETKKKN